MIMELRRSRMGALITLLGSLALGSSPLRDRTPTVQTEVRRKAKVSKTPRKGRRTLHLVRGSAAEQSRRQADAELKRAFRRMRNLELVQRGGLKSSV